VPFEASHRRGGLIGGSEKNQYIGAEVAADPCPMDKVSSSNFLAMYWYRCAPHSNHDRILEKLVEIGLYVEHHVTSDGHDESHGSINLVFRALLARVDIFLGVVVPDDIADSSRQELGCRRAQSFPSA
jgi:hypothetical protein